MGLLRPSFLLLECWYSTANVVSFTAAKTLAESQHHQMLKASWFFLWVFLMATLMSHCGTRETVFLFVWSRNSGPSVQMFSQQLAGLCWEHPVPSCSQVEEPSCALRGAVLVPVELWDQALLSPSMVL